MKMFLLGYLAGFVTWVGIITYYFVKERYFL